MIVVKLLDAIEVAFLLVVDYKSISLIVRYYSSLKGIELCDGRVSVGISYLNFTKVIEETVHLTLRMTYFLPLSTLTVTAFVLPSLHQITSFF
jgi:hypothetical protein